MYRVFYLFIIALLVQGCASVPKQYDLGPISSSYTDLHGVQHKKAIGPFYEKVESGKELELQSVRPFYTSVKSSELKKQLTEVCWPLGSSKTIGEAYYIRILTGLYLDYDKSDPESRYRFWLIPFYFQGVDRHNETYRGLFPVYGSIHEFLGRDKISWTLFPLWFSTELRDIKSKSVLWPVYSKTIGENVYRHRVFPLWGVNNYKDEMKKRFILWPFWNDSQYNFKNNKGSGFMLFPLYGQVDSDKVKARWLFPPFFRYGEGGPSPKSHLLWPLIQKSKGDIEKFYVFPLYGKKKVGHVKRTFFLWPIFSHRTLDRSDALVKRSYGLPVWYANTSYPKINGVVQERASSVYRKAWPLFSYQREDDESRVRLLELWPAKNHGPIERNYAPLWTLFSRYANASGSDTELLWGMYRSHTRNKGAYTYKSIFPLVEWGKETENSVKIKRWAVLKGLLGYERKGDKRQWRLLYIFKFGDVKESSE